MAENKKRINIYMNVELNDSLKIQTVKEHSSVSEILSVRGAS
ncbi:hypothetical protein [Ligilactobacillus equi]|nr:hypothetical protein [Ligilactobacillus equi]